MPLPLSVGLNSLDVKFDLPYTPTHFPGELTKVENHWYGIINKNGFQLIFIIITIYLSYTLKNFYPLNLTMKKWKPEIVFFVKDNIDFMSAAKNFKSENLDFENSNLDIFSLLLPFSWDFLHL